MEFVETATFECGGCGRRSPSTWIDYDRLGYPVCPECGRVDRPFPVRPFGATPGALGRVVVETDAPASETAASAADVGTNTTRSMEPSR
ncbi:hypothetical protein [Halobaculum marinum]|uniref:Small CPxCG-related zinc finger protein n=1 Tax=Halobaculum marinum TaxID=3031996 RepID=A0ABD5WWC6_9EURY|nr:hypothetical protein [Halobaculum sp. DT55]